MLQKDGSFLVSGFNKGQVKHPLFGFGLLQNVEVFENRGIAKIKNRTVLSFSPDQLPLAEAYDTNGNIYTLTGDTGTGACYKNGALLQSGLNNAWDLKIYKDYLWVSYQTVISCYGPLSSAGAQWFGNVATGFNTDGSNTLAYYGKLLVGQNGVLYRANANSVAKIEVTASGTVGTAPSVTVTLENLNLKDGQFAVTLSEYGRNILVGTHVGNSYFDRGNFQGANLYPWNREAGTLGNPGLADLPVELNEQGMNATLSHANRFFVSAGTQGNIYETDGTNYKRIASLPYTKSGVFAQSTVYPNAMAISPRGTLLVGLSTFEDNAKGGIYEIDITVAPDPSTGEYPIAFQTISTKATGSSSAPLRIGFINTKSYQSMRVGWGSGTTYGVDDTNSEMYSDYGAVIESELTKVGDSQNPKTYEMAEWCLAESLAAGQNIRLSYRTNSNDDYTLIGTWGYTAGTDIIGVGNALSFVDKAGVTGAEYLQVKVEMDQALTTIFGFNVNLISVRLFNANE